MQTLNEEYLTVTEAATLVRVAPLDDPPVDPGRQSPCYRLGPRRVGLKREDLATLVTLISTGVKEAIERPDYAPIPVPKLTPEQKRRALEALEQAQQLSNQILARRGGKPFPPSWIIINEQRDERTRQLG